MPTLKSYILRLTALILVSITCSQSLVAQVTASFSATPLTGCAPLVVGFKDESTGNPNFWKWDLGNGTISFLQNPSATYFNPGTYTVKLVARNAAGSADSVVRINYITVYAIPTVDFLASDTTGCFPVTISFADLSNAGSGSLVSWEWDFGDGTTSTQQNPTHTYSSGGQFNVTLRVRNSFGCTRTISRIKYIKLNEGVDADFSFNNPGSCQPPTTVNFTNLSTGTGTLSYQWSFGDGGSSILPNPSYTYNTPGSYTVQLIVVNSNGCRDTIRKVNSIVIGTVQAGFSFTSPVCAGESVNLINTSSPAPSGAVWDFGDGTGSAAITPVKSYSAPGNYFIKLVSQFGACLDSLTLPITVLAKPAADFSSPNNRNCRAPHTVNFSSQITGTPAGITWYFGDGGTGSGPSPSHTYTSTGIFDVTLVVTNAAGCRDSVIKRQFVQIAPPQILSISNLPRRGCAPITINPVGNIISADPVVSYQWNFGDGGTSALPNPVHTYNSSGAYAVTLIVTTAGGCTDTLRMDSAVVAGVKPNAQFTANPRDVCAFTDIQFTDQSTGAITQWQWFFGDGGGSNQPNPTYQYSDTGYFNVMLVVSNNGCNDTLTIPNFIYIRPPVSAFLDSFVCPSPFTRHFRDRSIGATSWNWNFGDGNTSTSQNISHTYAAAGIYTVTLTVSNGTCTHSSSRPVRIVDEKADFVADDTVICKGSTVSFQTRNINISAIAGFNWDFGDGLVMNGGNAIGHTYNAAGNYTVRLIITDVLGCADTLVKPLYIRVNGPTADFNSLLPGVCLNSAVNFADSSKTDGIHPITKWDWQWGDGNTQSYTAPPFSHTYANPGSYTVTLTVTDSEGCRDSLVKPNNIFISRPIAGFFSPDTNACPFRPVRFINQSTGPALSYFWDFGDGNSSTQANPIHNYQAEGVYTIKLRITDQYGCTDTFTAPFYVEVLYPRARFALSDSVTTCPPLQINFTNQSLNAHTAYWDFGDGSTSTLNNPSHFYNFPGTYRVILKVTGNGTCEDTLSKLIVIKGPTGQFRYGGLTGCVPFTVSFQASTPDSASFIWDFNDGSTFATPDSNVTHAYMNPGIYVPKMILVDKAGCTVPITGTDTIKVYDVFASFNVNAAVFCDSGRVNFQNNSASNDLITGFLWNFGDGSSSTATNPVHNYTSSGSYDVQLIVTSQLGCKDTARLPADIKIVRSPQIAIGGGVNGCVPASVNFSGQLVVADTSAMTWQWSLGNGQTPTGASTGTLVYPNAGTYPIQLIGINSSGCRDTATQQFVVHPLPVVDAGLDTVICFGRGWNLNATGAATYTWSPATSLSCTNCPNPVARPDSAITYKVTGRSQFGCVAEDSVRLTLQYPLDMRIGRGDTLCRGEKAKLLASGQEVYNWTPAAGLSNPNSSNPIAQPDITTLYRVIGKDRRNCFADTGFIRVVVYPYPTVNAGPDQTVSGGTPVQLNATHSADVRRMRWIPATNLSCDQCPAPLARPTETTQYSLQVVNEGGCTAQDQVQIFIFCTTGNLYMPNTFSPNGDGANDVFYPRGKGLFSIKSFKIFNRWGELIFEKNNIGANDASAGWDGRHKGQPASPDVYVYLVDVICDNKTVFTYKGNIALIR